MGINELRKRDIWQDISEAKASEAEYTFFNVFQHVFSGTNFKIRSQITDFGTIYVDYPLSEQTLSEIYNPATPIKKHGITPDYAIEHRETGKTLYVEVKRQDGSGGYI